MSEYLEKTKMSEFLSVEFDRRKRKNGAYSLRAYARDLEISPSRLSEILQGTHGMSEKMATRIAEKLKLKAIEKKYWFDLVLTQSTRNASVRELAMKRILEIKKLERTKKISEDQFRMISEWHHSAILEITQLKQFKPEVEWVSQQLGVSISLVKDALQRLVSLGLLKITKDGRWEVVTEPSNVFSEIPSTAMRKFHRQILQNGIESVLYDAFHEREIQSMILAIPHGKVALFKNELNKFMLDFWEGLGESPKDSLYSLSVQLCPVKNRER